MKLFNFAGRAVVMVWLLIAGMACEKIGPVEPIDTPTAQAPHIIKLIDANSALQKTITASAPITVNDGGTLTLKFKGKGGEGIDLSLAFSPGTVSQDFTASVSVDDKDMGTTMEFGPSPTSFSRPAILDFYATGIDFGKLPRNATIKLYYYNSDTGQWEPMNAGSITWDIRQGWLKCEDGEIPHFSRYAFGY